MLNLRDGIIDDFINEPQVSSLLDLYSSGELTLLNGMHNHSLQYLLGYHEEFPYLLERGLKSTAGKIAKDLKGNKFGRVHLVGDEDTFTDHLGESVETDEKSNKFVIAGTVLSSTIMQNHLKNLCPEDLKSIAAIACAFLIVPGTQNPQTGETILPQNAKQILNHCGIQRGSKFIPVHHGPVLLQQMQFEA